MPQFGAHCLETPSLRPVLKKRLVDLWLTAAVVPVLSCLRSVHQRLSQVSGGDTAFCLTLDNHSSSA
jgi:hypothetical protein